MEAGTVTRVFIPISSVATIAVKILVRLAGAHPARALRCQRKRPVSRLTSATSCASTVGTGIGRRVAAGRGGDGVKGTAVGVDAGLAGSSPQSGRGRGADVRLAEASSRVVVAAVAGWGGAAEPTAPAMAPIPSNTIRRRENNLDMPVRQPSS